MSSHEYSFCRALPQSVSLESALQTLQRHQEIITLSPFVVEYHAAPRSLPSTESFEIIDKIDYLPFGLYSGTVSVQAVFTDRADGVNVVRDAPMGITFHEDWVIRPISTSLEGSKGTHELVLKVKMLANWALIALFKGMMERNHEKIYLDGMIEILTRKSQS